jgi:RimJ/RimL family protein N-acetyltransferase
MGKSFNLRELTKDDWKILLEWRNDQITRRNFFNSNLIKPSEHKAYINDTIINPNRTQFIFEFNMIPVGTIREDRLQKGEFELSYTISPMYRGKKIGEKMMALYLLARKGTFYCEVKEENIPSIKMIEKLGFILHDSEKKVNVYRLNNP